jgi:hypothetical protein
MAMPFETLVRQGLEYYLVRVMRIQFDGDEPPDHHYLLNHSFVNNVRPGKISRQHGVSLPRYLACGPVLQFQVISLLENMHTASSDFTAIG